MTALPLTPRWSKLDRHKVQLALKKSRARFRVVPAGRRSGKTECAKRFLVRKALGFRKFGDGFFVAAAPTRDQAKRIYWNDLKALVPKWAQLKTPSESDLTIYLLNGAEIAVVGMDKPERIEGRPLDGIVLDEYANMKARAWTEHVRPALSTKGRPGWAWMIGVPEGRNHYYKLYKTALAKQAKDPNGEWAVFTWPSSDILDPSEIASARETLDARTFRQEYEATFENFSGVAYHEFKDSIHAAETLGRFYNPKEPLIFAFDFNVSPGIAAVGQEIYYEGQNPHVDRESSVTAWLGEVWIPDNSNSRRVAKALLKAWKYHQGEVWLYGDASGGSRGSAKTEGSDWDLIKEVLRPVFQDRLKDKVPRKNGNERPRINAVNSRLMTDAGIARMLVDPEKCPHLVECFEGTTLIEGTGEILKERGSHLTHLTDGVGYYVVAEHPARSGKARPPMELSM